MDRPRTQNRLAGVALSLIGLIVLSAALLYLSFPNIFSRFGFWPCAWIFAVPLLAGLDHQPLTRRWLLGMLWGIAFYGGLLHWFIPYSEAGYFLFTAALSVQPILFCLFYRPPRQDRYREIFFIPALWVSSEYARQLLLSGFSWDIGHSQAFNPYAIQIAHLFGSCGVSFVLILVNTCVYRIVIFSSARIFCGRVMAAALILVFGYGTIALVQGDRLSASQNAFRVLSVQPNIDYAEKSNLGYIPEIIERQVRLTKIGIEEGSPDLIVWPETAIPVDCLVDEDIRLRLVQLAREARAHLLVGSAIFKDGLDYNSAVLFDPQGHAREVYDKRRLVPFTEYTPWGGFGRWVQGILRTVHYDFGVGQGPGMFDLDGRREQTKQLDPFGVLICSEDTIGMLFCEYSRKGAGGVIVLLNDGWFSPDAALMLHAQNAVMHAVENRIPVVRVANTGWSCAIDPLGRTGKKRPSGFNAENVFLYLVRPQNRITVYNRSGDAFCRLCLLFVLAVFLLRFGKKKR